MPSEYTKEDTIADAAAAKASYKPTHPELFEVVHAEGSFNSQLVACRDYKKGQVICDIQGTTPGPKKYTTVQVSRDLHIELNSDLVYLNHSCNPSVSFDTDKMQVIAHVDIRKEKCCKSIQGAKFLPTDVMDRYFVCSHIQELLKERDAQKA
ncbi:hypothetical protein BGZ67_009836 [Mortierella alpina]|nr:hypothetical protein BGZ67_009836 [Mortierella alpina]